MVEKEGALIPVASSGPPCQRENGSIFEKDDRRSNDSKVKHLLPDS
jgi:hypothetical protein